MDDKNNYLDIIDIDELEKKEELLRNNINNNLDITDIDNLERKKKKISKRRLIGSLINIVIIGVILFCIFNIGKWFYDNYKNNKVKDSYKDIEEKIDNLNIDKINKNNTIDFTELKKQNPDTVAWIKVNNTKINYPVVKAEDNYYYLDKSFDKSYNSAGWIFMDYRNKLDGTDKNIIIYGHNRKNRSMFGSLDYVLKENWYKNKNNKILLLMTENNIQKYEVFSVYEIEIENYYISTNFTDKSYSNFLTTIKNRSIYNFNTKIDTSKNVLTLSTCSNNGKYRTVLHAILKN